MGGGGAAAQGDLHHGQVAVLDGVDQGLAQAQQLGDLGVVAHVDAGGILNPHHGDAVTGAQGDELVHLDQALAVQLAAGAHGLAVLLHLVLGVVGEHALLVGHHAHQKAVHLGQTGDHLGAVALLVLHELAAVEQAGEDGVHVVGAVLVVQHQVVQLHIGHEGRLGGVYAEELQVIAGQHVHVLLDALDDALLGLIDLAEEAGDAVVDGHRSGRIGPQTLGGLDLGQSGLHIHVGLGVHAAHDAGAAHGHVGLLMGHQDGGADGVVAAAGGVGAVDAHDDGDAHLVELGVAVEGGAAAPAVGVHQLLLIQLHAGALQQVDQGDAQPLGGVAAPEQVVGLAGHPGAGVLLVIGSDDDAPLAVDPAQALDDGGGAGLVLVGIIQAVQGAPGAGVHQQGDTLHGGELAAGVHGLVGLAVLQALHDLGVDVLLNGLEFRHVLGVGTDGLAHGGHVLEVAGHRIVTQCRFLLIQSSKSKETVNYSFGTLMKAWPGSISSRMSLMMSGPGPSISWARDRSISKPVFSCTISGEENG